jgi:hypothetical protein
MIFQAKLRRLEADFDKLEQRVQKEVRSKDSAVRQGLTITGSLSSRTDTKAVVMEGAGVSFSCLRVAMRVEQIKPLPNNRWKHRSSATVIEGAEDQV